VVDAINVHASCFTPCEVFIKPNIGKMLVDLGLVAAEQKWLRDESRPPFHPWTPLHTLYYGINAVILSTNDGPWQVQWTGPNQFTAKIEYSLYLRFLKFPYPADTLGDGDWSPEFFFREGIGGYHFGIQVFGHWWSANKERLEKTGIVKAIDDSYEDFGGRTQITLATLPSKVFWLFQFSQSSKQWKLKLIEGIKKELQSAGWKMGGLCNFRGEMDEISIDGDAHYVSEYAEVSLGHLPRGLSNLIGTVPNS
jgi:hypothetical protein